MTFKIILAVAFSLSSLTVGSQEPSIYVHGANAEDIVNKCDQQAGPGLSYCFGYILGVADMHNALNALLSSPKDNTYCLPDNASVSQLGKVVTKYGHDHPEELNQAALLLVNNAFTRAFPCK
jgi:hypothetical protein